MRFWLETPDLLFQNMSSSKSTTYLLSYLNTNDFLLRREKDLNPFSLYVPNRMHEFCYKSSEITNDTA